MTVQLIDAALPDFGVPAAMPELPRALYDVRLGALTKAYKAAGLDALVKYADREHSANLAWLTGFDPRFEEALLILSGSKRTLLAGPEARCRVHHSLLDETGRDELRDKLPQVSARVEARCAFMADVLGIQLKPEVLPLSNLAAALPPFLLASNRILALR